MAGYYRKFCKNFSEITAPLTELLKKGVKHHWSEVCHKSFDKEKNLLCLEPILSALNFSKAFWRAVNTSDVCAGAVLLQYDDEDIEHPICCFSKKIKVPQKNYSTVEKGFRRCIWMIVSSLVILGKNIKKGLRKFVSAHGGSWSWGTNQRQSQKHY